MSDAVDHALLEENKHLRQRIRELEKQVESYQQEIIRDPLTGLFNYRYLEDALEREVSRAFRHEHSVGVLMIAIDHFDSLTSTYGEKGINALLCAMSLFLRTHIRTEDVLCRNDTDKFTIIMGQANLENTLKRAKELTEKARQLKTQSGDQMVEGISISIGVACFPNQGATSEKILKAVQRALASARESGDGYVKVGEP